MIYNDIWSFYLNYIDAKIEEKNYLDQKILVQNSKNLLYMTISFCTSRYMSTSVALSGLNNRYNLIFCTKFLNFLNIFNTYFVII